MKRDLLKRFRFVLKPMKWVWLNKLRSFGYGLGLVALAYAGVFMLVSCSSSPTDQQIALADGRVLAYNEYAGGDPNGPQVILLHGAPADAKSWNTLVKRIGEVHAGEVLAVDRIGYGNSTNEDELTLAGHAATIAPLLHETAGQKPIIVGHSYGGPVALRLAVDYPEKVGGVVLVAGACDAYMQDSQLFRRGVDGVRLIVPEDWERANRELLALTDENRAMEPMLDRVTCPVVIVHGTWDGVCPHDSTVQYLKDRLVNAGPVKVVSLGRARHNLQLSHVDELIDAINGIE
ncbi:MAG: alpha/beta hydrolase [Phycisphaeraceae bacterium]|nr:alpha/beta hydrolase [Phycisphaeraceae bacterium]